MKACAGCGETKPLGDFYAANGKRDGRQSKCKECTKVATRAWSSANPDRVREHKRKWEREHRDKHLAARRAEYQRIKNDPAHKDYWRAYREANRDKLAADNREYRRHYRWVVLLRKYGITPDDYARMAAGQGGKCAICERGLADVQVHVDHCHATGAVRGLLCQRCNQGIGLLGDSAAVAARAATYLLHSAEATAT